jgi:hypothetical protein
MRRVVQVIGGAALAAVSAAYAGDFDGTRNLICAPVEVNDCVAVEGCIKTVPSEVGAPAFIRIDFAKQAMVGPERTSPIRLSERSGEQLLMMGTELGYAWSIALGMTTGAITVTMTNGEGSLVFFGACTPL